MKKITSAKKALAHLKKNFSGGFNENEAIQLLKFKSEKMDDTFIAWAQRLGEKDYICVTPDAEIIRTQAESLVDWKPYNNEEIGKFMTVIVDRNTGDINLDILIVPDSEVATKLLKEKYPNINSEVLLVWAYHVSPENKKVKTPQYFWAARINMFDYVAVGAFSGEVLVLPNNADLLQIVYYESMIENGYLLTEENNVFRLSR